MLMGVVPQFRGHKTCAPPTNRPPRLPCVACLSAFRWVICRCYVSIETLLLGAPLMTTFELDDLDYLPRPLHRLLEQGLPDTSMCESAPSIDDSNSTLSPFRPPPLPCHSAHSCWRQRLWSWLKLFYAVLPMPPSHSYAISA